MSLLGDPTGPVAPLPTQPHRLARPPKRDRAGAPSLPRSRLRGIGAPGEGLGGLMSLWWAPTGPIASLVPSALTDWVLDLPD